MKNFFNKAKDTNDEFTQKLSDLYAEVRAKLAKRIDENGTESKHFSDKSLKIKDENLMYNLSGGRYLTEIKKVSEFTDQIELVDNNGYLYECSVMDTTEFFEVADHLLTVY